MGFHDPIAAFLEQYGVLVLDGGLATALEAEGYDLADDLWSAKILIDQPGAVEAVHRAYLHAGADCIITSTYQASVPGLRKRGLGDAEAVAVLRRGSTLALAARDAFWADTDPRAGRGRPLVAASIGPFGAFLADGSEYTGVYDVGDDDLAAFHATRIRTVALDPVDILACETIPSAREADVLLRVLRDEPTHPAWLSFSCADEAHLWDGSRLETVARRCDAVPAVAAVGINCTAPELIGSLIAEARRGTSKPIAVYPNAGGRYEASTKTWTASRGASDWGAMALDWRRAGASLIGGCCRVGPREIAQIRSGVTTPER